MLDPRSRPALASARILIAWAAAFAFSPLTHASRAQDAAGDARKPWKATGRVTDPEGRPLAGVEIWAHCGIGTLFRTGLATTDADGRYELAFGPGILILGRDGRPTTQAATITAHKPGYFEENLGRQGNCVAADPPPDAETLRSWSVDRDRVFLPGNPLVLDFVMRPAARVAGRLIDAQGQPLARYSVSLVGPDMPPSSSVAATTVADEQGRFALSDVPTTFRYQLVVRKADPKPPWDDSWASAALRFDRTDGPDQDLRAWFGPREIRIDAFVLRIDGPGKHDREATPIAAGAGTLDLTAPDPADVRESRPTLLHARTATLTLRNAPRPDAARSLVPEAVPAAPAVASKTKLTRTRPDAAGACTISFENPGGFDLQPGKHQAIFQVFIGASGAPDRQRIFRQLDIRDGRYEVPVTIPLGSLDQSRVSITFVTIQPDHDAWVRAFFHEGKGAPYSGIWTADGAPLPAIPLTTPKN